MSNHVKSIPISDAIPLVQSDPKIDKKLYLPLPLTRVIVSLDLEES